MKQLIPIYLLSLILFLIGLPSEYLWDDQLLIQNNPWAKDWNNIKDIWYWDLWKGIPGEHVSHWYRPLMAAHILLDEQLFAKALFPRYLCSLFWFWGMLFFLWKYLKRMEVQETVRLFLFSFIALHPVQQELMFFLAARNDSMVIVFSLLGIINKNQILKIIFFLLACLSKENAPLIISFFTALDFLHQKKDQASSSILSLSISCGLYFFWRVRLDIPFPSLNFHLPLEISTEYLRFIFTPFNLGTTESFPAKISIIGLFFLFYILIFLLKNKTIKEIMTIY